MAVDKGALVVRTLDNRNEATTYATYEELAAICELRFDARLWENADEKTQIRAMVQAFRDLETLVWSNYGGYAQNRDYEFQMRFAPSDPPLDDPDFVVQIKRAQAAQVMYILSGTQVRDMAAEGVSLTRALSGSDLEIKGYRGRVCVEAIELIGRWVELYPRMRRF